jgi:hypothetical protein
MRRKSHAAPFATYVDAERDKFRWLSGEDDITAYESSPNVVRNFCSHCGSTVPETLGKNRITIPASCLDEDPGVRPTAHIFSSSKAPWYEIADDLPQFDTYPNPDDGPNVKRPVHSPSSDGMLRGSYLY